MEGSDLYADVEVAPWEAVLGASVPVPTLEGTVSLKVPAGSTAGQKLRLRGQGLPREDGERGDLYAVLEIEVPSEVGPEERKLWEKLAAESRWRPEARG